MSADSFASNNDWVGGLAMIIRLVTVQLELNSQLELSSAKNLDSSWDNIFWTIHFKLSTKRRGKQFNWF